MSNRTAEEYTRRIERISDREFGISSFEAGGRWYCHIDDVDPGARVASGEGTTQEEAEQAAVDELRRRMTPGSTVTPG